LGLRTPRRERSCSNDCGEVGKRWSARLAQRAPHPTTLLEPRTPSSVALRVAAPRPVRARPLTHVGSPPRPVRARPLTHEVSCPGFALSARKLESIGARRQSPGQTASLRPSRAGKRVISRERACEGETAAKSVEGNRPRLARRLAVRASTNPALGAGANVTPWPSAGTMPCISNLPNLRGACGFLGGQLAEESPRWRDVGKASRVGAAR